MRRLRHTRLTRAVRDFYAETPPLGPADFIYPYFVTTGRGRRDSIEQMPGVYRFSVDELPRDLQATLAAGIGKILLFGVVESALKDPTGSYAARPDSVVAQAVRAIRERFGGDVAVITDICLCAYTDHGHCGVVSGGVIDNDQTLVWLARMAQAHAEAGADFVAPSAMMDGQVGAISAQLGAAGLSTRVIGYSAKYASGYYGPFREAAQSAPAFADRRTYQMDWRNGRQGLDEIAADLEEGAVMVMVKPAGAYLDVIAQAAQRFGSNVLLAYQVSGEYATLKAGAAMGLYDEREIFTENLTAIKRAGAKYIISYYAREFCAPPEADVCGPQGQC